MTTMATRPRADQLTTPSDIDELVGHTAGRALALAGIDVPGLPHWGESER